uniref:Uncharacterized protein n=1 Tax=Romanomermis culicivorax TaxID=13658 RepID=A0A915JFC5_ROMCU
MHIGRIKGDIGQKIYIKAFFDIFEQENDLRQHCGKCLTCVVKWLEDPDRSSIAAEEWADMYAYASPTIAHLFKMSDAATTKKRFDLIRTKT